MGRKNNVSRWIDLVIKKPKAVPIKALHNLSPLLSTKLYLELLFPLKVGYKLNLENPQSYNEKLQWLKLYYRDPILPKLVDKYEYKIFVQENLGAKYVVENYGVWNSFDAIDFNSLPNQFVLKTTHDQGGVIICKDKASFNYDAARKKMNKHLNTNLFYLMREWPYKQVSPRILAEELLIDPFKNDLLDYKFYCFNGEPKFMYISMGRHDGSGTSFTFYDMDFQFLDVRRPGFEVARDLIEKPDSWEEMIRLSRILSAGQPHVRIDFYSINNRIKTGEFTLFQGGGMMPFIPSKWDFEFGKYLELPTIQ